MLRLWNFPRHSNITSTLPCDDVKKEKKSCSVNFTSLCFVSLCFSSLMLWVTVSVSISAAFHASTARMWRWNWDGLPTFFSFSFVCLYTFFGWNLNFFKKRKKKMWKEISVKTLFFVHFLFAYNTSSIQMTRHLSNYSVTSQVLLWSAHWIYFLLSFS